MAETVRAVGESGESYIWDVLWCGEGRVRVRED